MSQKKEQKPVLLRDWIDEVGVVELAKLLKIQTATVRHWRRGSNLPADAMKQKIKKFSRGKVTYDAMIDQFDFKKYNLKKNKGTCSDENL